MKAQPESLRKACCRLLEPGKIQVDHRLCFGQHHLQIHLLRKRCSTAAQSLRIVDLKTCQQVMAIVIFVHLQVRDEGSHSRLSAPKRSMLGFPKSFLAQSSSLTT